MATPFTDLQLLNVWDMQGIEGEINELILSINERSGSSTADRPFVTSGHNVQGLAFWQSLQQWVLDQVAAGFWVIPSLYNPPHETIPVYTNDTIQDFFDDAGLGSLRFRRARQYDPSVNDWTNLDDDMWIAPTEGNPSNKAERGDIGGPWLIVDLQKCLSAFVKKTFPAPGLAGLEEDQGGHGGADGESTPAQAIQSARDSYSQPQTGTLPNTVDFDVGQAVEGFYSSVIGIQKSRRVSFFQFGFMAKGTLNNGVQLDFLIKAEKPFGSSTVFDTITSIFDAQGTGLVEDQYALIESAVIYAEDTDKTYISDDVIISDENPPPNAPTQTPEYKEQIILGFVVDSVAVVAKDFYTYG